jgi:DnaJ-class molecular chaperone
MSTHYDVLQIPTNASQEDIKRAYRNLARQHHPDKGGDTSHFQKIQEAYETLSDENKRAQYDAPPHQPFHSFGFGGGNSMFDMFMNFGFQHMNINFNRPMRQLSPCIQQLDVSLHEAFHGIHTNIQRTLRQRCKSCLSVCPECKGQGAVVKQIILQGHIRTASQMGCQTCGGNGLKFQKQQGCDCQNGFKTVVVDCRVDIQGHQLVPGQSSIRFAELGEQSQTYLEQSSDFVVTFQHKLPQDTSIENRDILYKPKCSVLSLLCGMEIVLPPEFKAAVDDLRVEIPPLSIDPSYSLTLAGKGLPKESGRGDLVIRPQIEYSECKTFTLSSDQKVDLKKILQRG